MEKPIPSSDEQPRSVLVRGVNWLGDAVMTTPALQRLRERFPRARIRLLTHQKLADLWLDHPHVDGVLTFQTADSAWAVGRRLRAEAFDLALVLPNSPRSALEVWLGRVPQRVGYRRPWRNWFLTKAIPARPGRLEMRKRSVPEIKRLAYGGTAPAGQAELIRAEQGAGAALTQAHQLYEYLHLAAALGASAAPVPPLLAVKPEASQAVAAKFGLSALIGAGPPVFGLNPGAEYGPAKRWPAERFIAAARAIRQRTGCTWLIFGGRGDLPIAAAIESALREPARAGQIAESQPILCNLAGKTSLRELLALLKACRVLLTNDTGPMHLAAALGVPVVVPFGSTSPELTGPGWPGDPRHQLLKSGAVCSPCFLRVCPIDFRCMNGIAVERVVEAVLRGGEREGRGA